ncbi:MAG: ATP-binding protein [Verrucomicrobiales bacterium]|nr:ATP-binding protein [Verrucomicrobiales bacterium]
MNFTEENIQALFGNEAAENESLDRLRSYFVKNDIFDRVTSETPLRILVGHKGIGKSALFRVAFAEDRENERLPIFVRPDDVITIANRDADFLEQIRDWKQGLLRIIGEKSFEQFGLDAPEGVSSALQKAANIVQFIVDTLSRAKNEINLDASKASAFQSLLEKKKIVVYIDDLDRGWEGHKGDIKRLSALLNAVRDLSTDHQGLRFRLALRSDVYHLVRTSDESTDKIEGSVIFQSWTNFEIFVLLVKRICAFKGEDLPTEKAKTISQEALSSMVNEVFVSVFTGRGHWNNTPIYRVLLSLIRKRPRDLIKLCTAAAREAANSKAQRIETKHLEAVFQSYSQGRIQDCVNEFKSELPEIQRLLLGMKPASKKKTTLEAFSYSSGELNSKIQNICQSGSFRFADGKLATLHDLGYFLFKINFIHARKEIEDGTIQRIDFEENKFLANKFFDFGYTWEVHAAFRWALQPDSVFSILDNLSTPIDISK